MLPAWTRLLRLGRADLARMERTAGYGLCSLLSTGPRPSDGERLRFRTRVRGRSGSLCGRAAGTRLTGSCLPGHGRWPALGVAEDGGGASAYPQLVPVRRSRGRFSCGVLAVFRPAGRVGGATREPVLAARG